MKRRGRGRGQARRLSRVYSSYPFIIPFWVLEIIVLLLFQRRIDCWLCRRSRNRLSSATEARSPEKDARSSRIGHRKQEHARQISLSRTLAFEPPFAKERAGSSPTGRYYDLTTIIRCFKDMQIPHVLELRENNVGNRCSGPFSLS